MRIFPVPVTRKRFLAPDLVFIFGILILWLGGLAPAYIGRPGNAFWPGRVGEGEGFNRQKVNLQASNQPKAAFNSLNRLAFPRPV